MADKFKGMGAGLASPLTDAQVVAPNDAVDLPQVSRALYVGTAGDARVSMAGGGDLIIKKLAVGWHPLRVSRVWSTGTTAADITAAW